MVTPDKTGKIWNRGTKLGLIYAVVTLLILGLTTTQDPEGTLAWLQKFSFLVVLPPFAAASQAYVFGLRDAAKSK